MSVKLNDYIIFDDVIDAILTKQGKIVINTINAHSYIVAKKDTAFKEALLNSDILLPDGEGVVMMAKKLKGKKINKIAGADLHQFLVEYANTNKLKCFYFGSSEEVLETIVKKIEKNFPNIEVGSYSPPFKDFFSENENREIINQINTFAPDILFVGMTAPKQEKWLQENKDKINFKYAGAIGAVFDFYAGTKSRAPKWIIDMKLEWLHRALTSWRLTKRYLYSNPLFMLEVLRLKINGKF